VDSMVRKIETDKKAGKVTRKQIRIVGLIARKGFPAAQSYFKASRVICQRNLHLSRNAVCLDCGAAEFTVPKSELRPACKGRRRCGRLTWISSVIV